MNAWVPVLPTLACGALCLQINVSSAQVGYGVVPIYPPAVGDARYSAGLALNDLGRVVGDYNRFAYPPGQYQTLRSFDYSDESGTVELAWPSGWISSAVGINNQGQIALYGGETSSQFQAYRFNPGVGYEVLGSFGGPVTEAEAINSLGQVTGFSENANGHSHAFRYTDGVGLEDIGASFTASRGFAINDSGAVAGSGDGRAFLYRDGEGLIDLGPGRAYGINNAGTVVGEAFRPWGTSEAFIYQDGQVRFLGELGGGWAMLSDINNEGLGVGNGTLVLNNSVHQHALFWSEAAGLVDLNTFLPEDSGWTLISAAAINDLGQITGQGVFNGQPLAYRLDPIPEPATWALLALSGLLWLGRRSFFRS